MIVCEMVKEFRVQPDPNLHIHERCPTYRQTPCIPTTMLVVVAIIVEVSQPTRTSPKAAYLRAG